MKTIQAEVPDNLYNETMNLVNDGWYRDKDEIILDALRRYLDAHRPELMEKFVKEDVEWGLHGDE